MLGKIAWVVVLGVCLLLNMLDIWRLYREAIFNYTYVEKCTEDGYLEASSTFDAEDMDVELWGRSFLITGANSPIGKSAALLIAGKGGTVHMICRNPERAEQTRRDIVAKTGNENVHVHVLDMSNIAAVHRYVINFSLGEQKLDVLINNAGYLANKRTLTPEGLEISFATNTLGNYALTTGLLPLLKKSDDPRVVMVGSHCLLKEELVVDDLHHEKTSFISEQAYCQQKRHQLVLSEELAKLFPRIQFSTVDPGLVDTPGFQTYNGVKRKLRTPAQGADTIVWLAISDVALMFANGLFYVDHQPIPTHLPFGFTRETKSDRKVLMHQLADISKRLKPDD